MKTNFKHLAIVASLGVVMYSCDNDDNPSSNGPEILTFEYGEGSTHSSEQVAYIGSDVHMESEIMAENVVESITVDIHGHDLLLQAGQEEWDYEMTYTDAKYQAKNIEFHEHIDIPANAPAGEYHVDFIVTDAAGNVTEMEGDLEIMSPVFVYDDETATEAQRGTEIHMEFMMFALNGIHSIEVDIHGHDITVGDGEEEWDFEQEFDSYHEMSGDVEFHEDIEIPANAPAGEYHAMIKIEDEDGFVIEYEIDIDVTQ